LINVFEDYKIDQYKIEFYESFS